MLVLLLACRTPQPLLAPDAGFPERLSELGYRDDPDVVFYEPRFPLWSNGLDKERWAHVPGVVRARSSGWRFPVGTLLGKTFSGAAGPIETRLMRRMDDGWDFAVYLWDGGDAVALDMLEGVPVEGGDHIVPSRFQCRVCHEAGNGPLGLDGLQVVAQSPIEAVLDRSPEPVDLSDDPEEAAVLGVLVGNCVHCHDGASGPLNAFDLRPDVALENLIDAPTESSASIEGIRVVPGEPEESVLYQAMAREPIEGLRAMPPLGVQIRDDEALEVVRTWIEGL